MIIRCMLPKILSATDIFCHSGPFFALLPRKLKFGKNVKETGHIILLQMCIINDDV